MGTAGVLVRVVAGVGWVLLAVACAEVDLDSQFATCMKDAGHHDVASNVDMRRQQDPGFNKAFEGCARTFGIEVAPPGEVTRQTDAIVVRIFECMTAAGWNVPDPVRSEYGTLVLEGIETGTPADRLPAFKADYHTCIELSKSGPPQQHDHGDHKH
jgi:hypothetical protein